MQHVPRKLIDVHTNLAFETAKVVINGLLVLSTLGFDISMDEYFVEIVINFLLFDDLGFADVIVIFLDTGFAAC